MLCEHTFSVALSWDYFTGTFDIIQTDFKSSYPISVSKL